MSRLIFVCSGNTCRSPMAVGLARRVFGDSHTIVSAGAETATGAPAAKNAVTALAEIGVDIVNHSSVDVADLDLTNFDLIVVFRPSAAESVSLPPTVRVEYLDVSDPHGGTVDTYRIAARSIERGVRQLYVEDALRRVSAESGPGGSHLSGILNRAAKECEKEVAEFVARQLSRPVHDKATLGHLARSIDESAASGGKPGLAELSAAVAAANEVWRRVKHTNDPSGSDLVAGLAAIRKVFLLLNRNRLS